MNISFDIVTREYRHGRMQKIEPCLRITVTTRNRDPYNPYEDMQEADVYLRELRDALNALDKEE